MRQTEGKLSFVCRALRNREQEAELKPSVFCLYGHGTVILFNNAADALHAIAVIAGVLSRGGKTGDKTDITLVTVLHPNPESGENPSGG